MKDSVTTPCWVFHAWVYLLPHGKEFGNERHCKKCGLHQIVDFGNNWRTDEVETLAARMKP